MTPYDRRFSAFRAVQANPAIAEGVCRLARAVKGQVRAK